MTRALGTFAAVAAFAASAVPVASANQSAQPPSRGTTGAQGHIDLWASAKGGASGEVANHTEGKIRGINAAGGWDPLRRTGLS